MSLHPAVGLDNPPVGQNVDSKKDQTQEEAGEAPADNTLCHSLTSFTDPALISHSHHRGAGLIGLSVCGVLKI